MSIVLTSGSWEGELRKRWRKEKRKEGEEGGEARGGGRGRKEARGGSREGRERKENRGARREGRGGRRLEEDYKGKKEGRIEQRKERDEKDKAMMNGEGRDGKICTKLIDSSVKCKWRQKDLRMKLCHDGCFLYISLAGGVPPVMPIYGDWVDCFKHFRSGVSTSIPLLNTTLLSLNSASTLV